MTSRYSLLKIDKSLLLLVKYFSGGDEGISRLPRLKQHGHYSDKQDKN